MSVSSDSFCSKPRTPRLWAAAMAAATLAASAVTAQAQTGLAAKFVAKLMPPVPLGKNSGGILATDGDWLAVGNPAGATPSVFIYHRMGAAWLFHQELHASDQGLPGAAESFGASLAMDGDTLAVGGWVGHTDCSDADACVPIDTDGGAYIFSLEDDGGGPTWNETAILVPSAPVVVSDFNYGSSIALSDGVVSVGARAHWLSPVGDFGAVFVFRFDGPAGWNHMATIDEPPGSEFYFAHALAQSGTTLAMGAPYTNALLPGMAMVYQLDPVAGTANLVQELPSLAIGDPEEYGQDVDIDGDFIVVGSNVEDSSAGVATGRAYVWRRDPATNAWSVDTVLETFDLVEHDGFGYRVALRNRTVVVASYGADHVGANAGAAYPFYRSGDTWVAGPAIEAVAFDGMLAGDHFGLEIALQADGMAFFSGAPNDTEWGNQVGSVSRVELGYTCGGLLATIIGTDGPDNLVSGGASDVIVGLEGDDVIRGQAGNDVICGGGGADRLSGGDQGDYLWGEDGDDVLYGNSGGDAMYGGAGADTLSGDDDNDIMFGGPGADALSGGDGSELMFGGAGDDNMNGGAGNDLMWGEAGNDLLHGDADRDQLAGGDGNDTLYGGDGIDKIYGGDGNDALWGEFGDDILDAGDGDDYLSGGWGSNTCDGGPGTDTGYFCQVSIDIP